VKKLYVGNLPFSATEDTLHEFFSQAGVNPSGVNLIRDRFTGQSRGFAFVEIANDEARPQRDGPGGGGGGGRGGYGGRGGQGGGRGRGDRGDRGNRW